MKALSEIEILREKLHHAIDENYKEGESTEEILNHSQELDKLIVIETRRLVDVHKG